VLGSLFASVCFPACAGAPAYGDLEITGIGPALNAASAPDVKELRESCLASNTELLRSLKQVDAETGDAMLQHVWAEAKEGRMSEPVPATEMDLSSVLLHPRRADACVCCNSCMFHQAFVAGSLLSKHALMAARSCV